MTGTCDHDFVHSHRRRAKEWKHAYSGWWCIRCGQPNRVGQPWLPEDLREALASVCLAARAELEKPDAGR